jgi:hypothetical protein
VGDEGLDRRVRDPDLTQGGEDGPDVVEEGAVGSDDENA